VDWNITMLAIHLVALVLAALLYTRAPCWLQRLVVAGLAIAFAVISLAYVLALRGVDSWWHVLLVGFALEHAAVLLYVFRIVWQGGLNGSRRDAPAIR
jgi:p-aminobenzoyl-glutamate transporter AbgT